MLPGVKPCHDILLSCFLSLCHGRNITAGCQANNLKDIKLALSIPTPPFGIFTCSTFRPLWNLQPTLSKGKERGRHIFFPTAKGSTQQKQTNKEPRDRGGSQTDK